VKSRIILFPTVMGNGAFSLIDKYAHFLYMLVNQLGFKLMFCVGDVPEGILTGGEYVDDVEVVFTFKSPLNWNAKSLKSICDIDKKIKVISFFSDFYPTTKTFLGVIQRTLDRVDAFLSPSVYCVNKFWYHWKEKYSYFPQFFGSYERYANLPFNEDPVMKCCFSGRYQHNAYPIRQQFLELLFNDLNSEKYFHFMHYYILSKSHYRGDFYAKELHKYFCNLTASTRQKYVVGKYLEVPATGSLLLAEKLSYFEDMGFKPDTHYIPVTPLNVLDKIKECLAHPEDYTEIRKRARKLALTKYSVNNRFAQFKTILKNLKIGDI